MRSKWFELANWHLKRESPDGSADGNNAHEAAAEGGKAAAKIPGAARLQIELLPTEDVYRSARIMKVRGRSIQKVIEMLRSEHIRGLSNELKRAALLMALEASGIAVDQMLRDAKARQEALDAYEAEQKRRVEAEWARRAEENAELQAELELLKEQYMARISHNLEGVEREKATFAAWMEAAAGVANHRRSRGNVYQERSESRSGRGRFAQLVKHTAVSQRDGVLRRSIAFCGKIRRP